MGLLRRLPAPVEAAFWVLVTLGGLGAFTSLMVFLGVLFGAMGPLAFMGILLVALCYRMAIEVVREARSKK